MAEFVDPAQRLFDILDRAEPRMRDEFLALVAALSESFTIAEIASLIEAGRLGDLILEVDRAARALASVYTANWAASASSAARFLSDKLSVVIRFDAVNDRAVRAAQANQVRLVRGLTTEARDVVRQALITGQVRGMNPIGTARLIRDSLGLTPAQLGYVDSYRRALESGSRAALDRALRDRRFDRTVASAARRGAPLSSDQVDRMVERYRERWIKHRAEVVGRTEALRATHQGNQEMYRQALDEGVIDPLSLERRWTPARDARVRDSHQAMRGQVRDLDEPFTSGLGNSLLYPGDPSAPAEDVVQCRCALATRVRSVALAA